MSRLQLTPELLLNAYSQGMFPMAHSREGGAIRWYSPDPRTIIEFLSFVPGSHFRRLMRTHPFRLRINHDFRAVITACAQPRTTETQTWISPEIIDSYCELHRLGHAHSVEAWLGDELAGGLYLVQLGAATMGESMFSRRTDASKVCLLFLMDRLKQLGFQLLDTQYWTPHLQRFGAVGIPRTVYLARLATALTAVPVPKFDGPPTDIPAPAPNKTPRAGTNLGDCDSEHE